VKKDPLEEALAKIGVHLEKKDVNPVTQMIAGGVGGIAGSVLGGSVFNLGAIGKAVASLAGAVIGHVAVTYRIHLEKPAPRSDEPISEPPESPMSVSDRR
jgi:hypothetical protein